jgi:hypothetical protein
MNKIAIRLCFIILGYLTCTGAAHAGWVQTNCVWVKITVNSESDGWRMECDLEYLPDPSSGLDSGGGSGGSNDASRAETIVQRILKNSCVKSKSGEDCGAFGVRLEGQCFLETGLSQISRFCANFGNDAAIACSSGQIPICP